jgi:ADP-ribosylglycohydrolase
MLGAIAGDIIGSAYEARPVKTVDFALFPPEARFTDDTVLTLATAEALLGDGDYAGAYRRYGRAFPDAGYGGRFLGWLLDEHAGPYNSWGNGSAMRVSPVGFALDTVGEVLAEAARSAAVTHNHPEGIKGAQATALAVLLARSGEDKATIKTEIQQRFGYDLERSLDAIRPGYFFDVSCQGSVPEALIAFLGGAVRSCSPDGSLPSESKSASACSSRHCPSTASRSALWRCRSPERVRWWAPPLCSNGDLATGLPRIRRRVGMISSLHYRLSR